MTKPYISGIAVALGCLGVSLAQAQQPQQQPQPSTHPAEGTAADRSKPGETPTRTMTPAEERQQQDPRPSTSQTEGTAADTTPPGQTPTTQGGQAAQRGAERSDIIGAAVVTSGNAPLGEVVDVVFDARNQPAFVVIESGGQSTAVPYSVASSMKSQDKIVMEQAKLKAAPKVKEGEWRDQSNSSWKKDASRYWDRG